MPSPNKLRLGRMRRTRKQNKPSAKVQHHHMLLRMELEKCPGKEDKEKVEHMIQQIINDIQMKSLAAPHVYYMTYPRWNEGLTGIAPIETSHIALHVWDECEPALAQLDVYTCSALNTDDVFEAMKEWDPVQVEYKYIDREHGLTLIETKVL